MAFNTFKECPPDAEHYLRTHSAQDSALHYRTTRRVIARWRRELGIHMWTRTDPNTTTPKRILLAKFKELREHGRTFEQIATEFNCSRQNVQQLLKKAEL